jgi:biopolymer transport protein ExbB
MKALFELIREGGPAMIAIIALSVVLYSRCFKLLLTLRRSRRLLRRTGPQAVHDLREKDRIQNELHESFRQHRVSLSAMIAAAPLLGLLGTVSGMVKTFESISSRTGEKSMEGLARGISEVLIATQSGLMVALPALVFVYLAHREVRRLVGQVNRLESAEGRAHA